jgi:hypothetical protein
MHTFSSGATFAVLSLVALLGATPGAIAQNAPVDSRSASSPRLEPGAQLGDFVVPIHTAEADMGVPYGVWTAGARYKASFHDGATFVPMLGASYPHNLPLSWRTTSVRVGDDELVTQPPRLTWNEQRAEYDLGAVTEAYDVRLDGIEQTFVVARRPAASGDLVVRGAITTLLHAANVDAAHQPLRFRDEQGKELVVYGAATAVDARGNQRPMTTSFANGEVTLRLDAAWLATATFPLVVDPLLGPGASVTGATRHEVDVVHELEEISSDAIWVAYSFEASASDLDVFVRRFHFDGTLGPLAFTDITASWSTSDPRSSYVGNVDHVVTVFDRFFASTQQRYVRFHRHDVTDMTVDTSFGSIAATDNAWRADVSGVLSSSPNPTQALVVWQQEPNSGPFANTASSDIWGCYLDVLAGTAGTPFAIATTALVDHERPSLTTAAQGGSSGWAIAYQTYSSIVLNDDWDIAVRLINLTGGITAALAIDNASPDHKMAPLIEGGMTELLVAFTTSTLAQQPGKPAGINGHQLRVVRVDWSYVDPMGTEPHGTVLLQSNNDPRLELAGLGWDRDTKSHWTLMFRSNATEVLYSRTVGYRGQELWAETVLNPSGSDVSVRGGVTFNGGSSAEYVLAYGVNGGANNYVTIDRYVYPAVTPWSVTGPACSTVSLFWGGPQLIGSQNIRLSVTGSPIGALHLLVMASAPASALLVGIPPVVSGCWLLVPNVGQDHLGILVGVGHAATWIFDLPETLSSATFYFQDFHTDTSGTFSLLSTGRLEVPLVR